MRRLLLGLSGLILAGPAFADPIDDIVKEQMSVSHLPGVAVAIVDRGKVTKLAGYGRGLEWASPVDPDVRFQLLPTKLFTAILLIVIEQAACLSTTLCRNSSRGRRKAGPAFVCANSRTTAPVLARIPRPPKAKDRCGGRRSGNAPTSSV